MSVSVSRIPHQNLNSEQTTMSRCARPLCVVTLVGTALLLETGHDLRPACIVSVLKSDSPADRTDSAPPSLILQRERERESHAIRHKLESRPKEQSGLLCALDERPQSECAQGGTQRVYMYIIYIQCCHSGRRT